MRIGGRTFTRREIERSVGNISQLGGIRHVELTEGRARGVRAAEFHTGSGLAVTVLPDRGLDIADCSYRGVGLVYLSPGGIAHPSYHDPAGMEWLRTFFGGLLTTCGLTYFGSPGRDGEEDLGLHGRYAGLPAARYADLSRWDGDEYMLEIEGTVEECVLFGDKLRLKRSISAILGGSRLRIRDTVKNFGSRSSPFTILYHINAGFPLLGAASELVLSSRAVESFDAKAEECVGDVARFTAPDPAATGLDYLHSMAADARGWAHAALVNRALAGGLALAISFRTDTLPYLNEWKMLGEVDYLVGVEPVNVKTVNRAILRSEGRLPMIEAGETREMEVEIAVLEGAAEIGSFEADVKRILAAAR